MPVKRALPSSRPPIARMLRIHEELQDGHLTNCSKLAGKLEVSTKTIMRDLAFMRDQTCAAPARAVSAPNEARASSALSNGTSVQHCRMTWRARSRNRWLLPITPPPRDRKSTLLNSSHLGI